MVTDLDIWRAAHALLRQHGDDAGTIAAQRADKMLADGDLDGLAVWRRIVRAVEELTRERRKGDQVH